MTYENWLAATLSVLTIGLTILGVVIAIVAIWGYRSIKEDAANSAAKAALFKISEYLDSQEIQNKLKEEIGKRVAEEADKLFADLSLSGAYPTRPTGIAEQGSVAETYPEPQPGGEDAR